MCVCVCVCVPRQLNYPDLYQTAEAATVQSVGIGAATEHLTYKTAKNYVRARLLKK